MFRGGGLNLPQALWLSTHLTNLQTTAKSLREGAIGGKPAIQMVQVELHRGEVHREVRLWQNRLKLLDGVAALVLEAEALVGLCKSSIQYTWHRAMLRALFLH